MDELVVKRPLGICDLIYMEFHIENGSDLIQIEIRFLNQDKANCEHSEMAMID